MSVPGLQGREGMGGAEARGDPGGRVLGLLAKQPRVGQVKTRLAAESSVEWAAKVAHAVLLDTISRLSAVAARRVLAFSPAAAEAFFADLAAGRFALVQQVAGDLGRRMQSFLAGEFAAGAGQVLLLGADSPTVPLALIDQAFQELQRADVVLGPATDGGYYLVGCAGRVPPIFDGPAWGSPSVLADTVARLGTDWRLAMLPPWYDVDTLADWCVLKGHLVAMRRAGIDPGLPHVEQLIAQEGASAKA
ncbi:MAG TPA: TIGR04282 family arsenosugar biosynthesis glycosyltransferase [Gemmataceae bacterium]|nr:TIGR04282 family arsenosugar biosynthesis glycosyltransferase [Gemmataceae bacterium]